jgi:hypothetical protein
VYEDEVEIRRLRLCRVVRSALVRCCRSSRLALPVDDVRLNSEQSKRRCSEATETTRPTLRKDGAEGFVRKLHLDLSIGQKD